MNWKPGCLGLVLFGLSCLAVSAAGQSTGPDISSDVVKALITSLKPADLALRGAPLREKLNAIGADSGLFQVAEDMTGADGSRTPMPSLSPVAGSSREVVAVLEPTSGSNQSRLTCWIGVLGGHVLARPIPCNSDPAIGPVYGAWKRRGNVLVGVGYDESYHSPTWSDAEIYVFSETARGPRMDQRLKIGADGPPFGFLNAQSLTIACRQHDDKGYTTIYGGPGSGPWCTKIWELHRRRYVLVKTISLHDKRWEVDRLMTAIAKNRESTLREMIPDGPHRKDFLRRLRTALARDVTMIDKSGELTLISDGHPREGIDIELENTKSGWLVRNVRTKPLPNR